MAPVSMDEGRRQAYLASLGLPLWSVRHDLPGAAPAAWLTFEPFLAEPASNDVAESAEAPAAFLPEPVGVSSAPVNMTADVAAPVRPDASPPTVPVAPERRAPTAAATTTTTTRFALRVQALAPGWLGIVALGEVPDLSSHEHRLLSALGSALGASPEFTVSASLLRWPIARANPGLNQGEEAAIEWLRHALKVPDGWRCLVLGEAMSVQVRAALPSSITMVAGPSLAMMLSSPMAKKSLWLSLHA